MKSKYVYYELKIKMSDWCRMWTYVNEMRGQDKLDGFFKGVKYKPFLFNPISILVAFAFNFGHIALDSLKSVLLLFQDCFLEFRNL